MVGLAGVGVGGIGRAGAACRFTKNLSQRVREVLLDFRSQRGRRVLSQRLMLISTDSDVVYWLWAKFTFDMLALMWTKQMPAMARDDAV
jgi:hypothetical protein